MISKDKPRVLVVTMSDNLAWPVVRGLYLGGAVPYVLGKRPLSSLAMTRECAVYQPFRRIKKDGRELSISLMDEVDSAADRHSINIIMAADFDSTLLLSKARKTRMIGASLAVTPTPENMRRLHDKWQLAMLLDELGLPYPRSVLAHSIEEVPTAFSTFPIITKPLALSSSVGVQIHRSSAELAETVEANRLCRAFPLIVQEFIPGWDVGYSFFADKGKILASALCRYKGRGVRSYFQDGRMDRMVGKLLEASTYSGIGHVDARYDPDRGEYRILELNPRFWASVLYVANAGVNFPALLLRHTLGLSLGISLPNARRVRLPAYERAVTMFVRVIEQYYERRDPSLVA